MSAKRMALKWVLRVGIATAILAGIGILGNPGNAMAANLSPRQYMVAATDGIRMHGDELPLGGQDGQGR